jgi:hypothetical protein
LHRGTVHAESDGEGRGATFRLRLPPCRRRDDSNETVVAGEAATTSPLSLPASSRWSISAFSSSMTMLTGAP